MKKLLVTILKSLASFILSAVLVFAVFSVSPIYDFAGPQPFSGPDVFNPYAGFNPEYGWKRANFHTHTRVKGLFNECEYWPAYVDSCYRSFGYDIVTFSNHNKLTRHPYDSSLQVNVYEHGYNLFKYHKLVFGCGKVMPFDHLLPILASQRQFQMDLLAKTSDFIQLNHPFRTLCTSKRIMECLSAYRITELDSGVTTGNDYWDWALSAGHYSFGLANDDLHYPDRSDRFAVRCNFLNSPSGRYEDIRATLLEGAYYSMRVPDYGAGNWETKRRENASLPSISSIGSRSDTVFIKLTEPASEILVYGQDHTVLCSAASADSLEYVLRPADSYARFTACFDDGAVIYSNPFARYDSEKSESPCSVARHDVNILLTIIFNAGLLLLIYVCARLLRRLWHVASDR